MYPHVFKNFAHALRFFSKFLGCFLSFSFSPTLFSVFSSFSSCMRISSCLCQRQFLFLSSSSAATTISSLCVHCLFYVCPFFSTSNHRHFIRQPSYNRTASLAALAIVWLLPDVVSITVFVQHVSISVSGSIAVAVSIYCRWLTSLSSSTALLAEVHCLAALFGLHTDDVRLPLWPLLSGHSGSPAPVRPLPTILCAPTVVRSVWPLRLLSGQFGRSSFSDPVVLFGPFRRVYSRCSSVSVRACLDTPAASPSLSRVAILVVIDRSSAPIRPHRLLFCRCAATLATFVHSGRSSGCLSVVFWLCVWSVFSVICPVLSYPFSVVSLESVCFLFARPFVSVCACAV